MSNSAVPTLPPIDQPPNSSNESEGVKLRKASKGEVDDLFKALGVTRGGDLLGDMVKAGVSLDIPTPGLRLAVHDNIVQSGQPDEKANHQ
eukprot:2448196-Pyramimonas_sp.AAC.1